MRSFQLRACLTLISLSTAIAAAAFLVSCTHNEDARPATRGKPQLMELASPARSASWQLQGSVVPAEAEKLSFDIESKIAEIRCRPSERVEAGQVLVRSVPSPDLRAKQAEIAAQLAHAQARLSAVRSGRNPETLRELALAEARLKQTRAALEQLVPLVKSGVASRNEYGAARKAFEQARIDYVKHAEALRAMPASTPEQTHSGEAEVEQLALKLKQASAAVTGTDISSPVDGTISFVYVKRGQKVGAAQPVVGVLGDRTALVAVEVPAECMQLLRSAPESTMTVVLEPPGTDLSARCKIPPADSAQASNAATRLRLAVQLPAGIEASPGKGARVRIETGLRTAPPAFIIPMSAVSTKYGHPCVWAAEGMTSVAMRRQVTTCEFQQGKVIVLDGLETGDRIIAALPDQVQEALEVR